MTDHSLFSSAYGTYTKIDCFLVIKQNINKCKGIDIIQSMIYSHNLNKLGINNRKIYGNFKVFI